MATLNLTTSANDSDTHASSGATDAGKRPGLGTVSDASLLAPGSHGGNDEYSAAVRFTSVTIPQGTVLTSALFSLRATATYDASPNVIKLIVSCQAADNAGALATSGSTDLDGATRAGTTADTTWTVTSVTGGTRYTADITTAVQEVIDRAGWASGNAIVVLVDTHADTTLGEWQDFDPHNTAGSTNGPRLDIEYSTGQLARPDADVTGSPTWTGDGGETTNLYQRIDEASASDTDYIRSVLDPSADVHEVGLETLTDPASSSDHIVRYRARKQAAGDPIDLTVSLMQGATQIAAWTETALATSWSTVTRTLTGGEADAITDYADLRLRFSATQGAPATAPTYVAAGTMANTATSGATMAPGLPAGAVADDIGVLVVHTSSNVDFSDTITGWTKLSSTENNTSAQRVELWVRRFTGSGDAPTVPGITSTEVRVSRIFAVRGCPTTGNAEDHIVLARSNNAASATVTIPDATAAVANTLSVAVYAYEDDPTAASTVSGFAAWDITRTTTGNDAAIGMNATRTNTTSGSKTGGTSTVSGGTFANSVNVGLHFLFNPAAVDARANVSWAELEVPQASGGGPIQVNQDAQLAYHVRAAVNDTMALGWHTRAPVGKESAQAWHVRTPVNDDAPLGWHARAVAGQSGQLAYHLRALATDDAALAFHVRSLIADDAALAYHVRSLVADESALGWHVRALVADDAPLGWHTRAVAAKTAQIAHHVRAVTADTAQLAYHVRSLVTDDAALAWHLRAVVADTIGLGWHVAGAPGVVGADLALAWHLRTTAQQDGALGWHDRVAIGDDAALAWALRSLVADQVALGWHLRGMVSDDAALGWRVAVQSLVAGADLPLGWHARKAITTAAALGWHLAAQSGGIAAGSSVLGAAISGGATRTSIGGGQAGATLTQGAMRGRWD